MDQRFTLALAALVLVGGALALWLVPQQQDQPPPLDAAPPPVAVPDGPARFGLYTLAIAWQPAFCETEPRQPECRSLSGTRSDADHFALHGLWPEGQYCGVSEDLVDADLYGPRRDLPDLDLTPATRSALDRIMPGTQSYLERHEWLLHGTCAETSAEAYFARAIALVDALNASAVRDLFAGSIGKRLSRDAIRSAMDKAFGNGAGRRVRVDCLEDGNRTLIGELRLRLYGDVISSALLAELVRAATPSGSGCDGGLVDRVGDQ